VAACVLMGGLRQANADVWRLDEEELREDRERRASRTSRQSASPGRSGGSSGSSSLRPA
jgi:hypothetical protein